MPYEITISGINTIFNKCIDWVTCKVDTPSTSNARTNFVGNYMNISGFIGTDEVTIGLYNWAILPVNDKSVFRNVQLTVKDANDNVIEKVSFPNAFVEFYRESYTRDKGLGKFDLQLKQKIDKNGDVGVSDSPADETSAAGSKILESVLGNAPKSDILDMGESEPEIELGKNELDALRNKWNVPETNTIAVGKTDIPGFEDAIFEGGSPTVRKEAGLPDLDIVMPDRAIKAPAENPLFTRHAEEGVANEFDIAMGNSGINPEDVNGTLRIHQSNSSGVCKKCIQGLANDSVKPGVLKQLSLKYPNVTIDVTSEIDESVNVSGKLAFRIRNGRYIP